MPQAATPPILSRAVSGSPGTMLTLTHYAGGQRQERHDHDHTQISFLLAGGIAETIGRRCHEVRTSGACVKLAGVDHENVWGRTGALMLTARLKAVDADDLAGTHMAAWRTGASPNRSLLRTLFKAASAAEVDDVVVDLIASLDAPGEASAGRPKWLGLIEQALWDGETPSATDAARLAGVHRVHLSRAFARHVGMPFSVYRRHVMVSRAVEAAVRRADRLAEVAADAGFADQSHMNRALASALGTSPRRLREALVA